MVDLHENSRIINPIRARQLIDFRGLSVGSMYPTDIDGIFEIKNRSYIIFEIKHGSAETPWGQKLAFKRMVDDFYKIGKPSIAIIGEHTVHNPDRNVDAALCRVREVYTSEKGWHKPTRDMTLQEAVDVFYNFYSNKRRVPPS